MLKQINENGRQLQTFCCYKKKKQMDWNCELNDFQCHSGI